MQKLKIDILKKKLGGPKKFKSTRLVKSKRRKEEKIRLVKNKYRLDDTH